MAIDKSPQVVAVAVANEEPKKTAADYKRAKRAEGKCGFSGCHALSGENYYCDPHRLAENKRVLALYHAKKARLKGAEA